MEALAPTSKSDAPSATRRNGYSLADDLKPIIDGKVEVPNFEPMDYGAFLNLLASGGHSLRPEWGWARGADGHKNWAFYFLSADGMGSPRGDRPSLGGGGYVTIYGRSYPKAEPKVGSFAICRHKKEDAPGADHRRGWHPGACSKCGLDMTIDSGD